MKVCIPMMCLGSDPKSRKAVVDVPSMSKLGPRHTFQSIVAPKPHRPSSPFSAKTRRSDDTAGLNIAFGCLQRDETSPEGNVRLSPRDNKDLSFVLMHIPSEVDKCSWAFTALSHNM